MLDNHPAPARSEREPEAASLALDLARGEPLIPRILWGSPDAVVVLDAQGQVMAAGPACAHVLGIDPGDLVQARFVDHAHPDDAEDFALALGRVGRGETLVDHSHRFGPENPRWVDWTAWRTGGQVMFLGRAAQVQRAALEAHWRSESRYRHLLDAVQEGVWFLDEELQTTYASPRMAAMLDSTPDQMVGAPLEYYLGRNAAAVIRGMHGRELARVSLEVALPGHSIPTRSGMLCACAVDDPDGRGGYLVTVVDITEQRLARLDLDRMNQQLENKVRRRTEALEAAKEDLEVVSLAVSHDVRGSLRAATAMLEWTGQEHADRLPEEVREGLAHVEQELRGVDTLVEGLLRLGHVGHRVLHITEVDLGALAREVVDGLQKRPGAEAVIFDVHDVPPCWADPDLVRDVLMNLLGNACKYACTGGGRVGLWGEPDAEGRWIDYTVRDDGPGFDADEAEHLFDLFRRGSNVDGTTGFGMGLAIVKRIILRHGGSVEAVPRPDGGEFRFRLPRHKWSEPDGTT